MKLLQWLKSWWFRPSSKGAMSRRSFLLAVPAVCLAPLAPKLAPAPVVASLATRDAVLAKYIMSAEGKRRLAEAMIQPLRTTRDYTGLTRRVLIVKNI